MAYFRWWIFGLFYFSLVSRLDAQVLCEEGFCRTYGFEVGCSSPAPDCRINNATYSGISLMSPTVCNCCEYCLPFYGEEELCSRGGTGDGITVGRCGPGLTCTPGDDAAYCRRIPASQSACHAKQDDFDARYERGETGVLEQRPLCDGKGNFGPVDCVPTQTCFCQSEDGERLFGEVLHRGSSTLQNMQCGCSRLNDKIQKLINSGVRFPAVGPRCTADGNFNPVQCINKKCYCVNRITGAILDGPYVDLDTKPISNLTCYRPEFDLFSRFETKEPPFNFTSPCLEDQKQKMELILESESDGFIMDYFSEVSGCLPDATYGRVSKTINGTKQCVDEWGVPIGDYYAEPYTEEYDNMNCNCAVTSSLMQTSLERPVCCHNGNFRPVQCRRGVCHCVDQNGRQTVKESEDVASLPCVTDDSWQSC